MDKIIPSSFCPNVPREYAYIMRMRRPTADLFFFFFFFLIVLAIHVCGSSITFVTPGNNQAINAMVTPHKPQYR